MAEDYWKKQLDTLVGGRIIKSIVDDSGYMGLMIETMNGFRILWFLSDEEGNNPGSFDIAELNIKKE